MRCTVFATFDFIMMLLIVKMLTFLIEQLERFPPAFVICVLMYVYPKFERDPSSTSQVIADYISVALAVALSV